VGALQANTTYTLTLAVGWALNTSAAPSASVSFVNGDGSGYSATGGVPTTPTLLTSAVTEPSAKGAFFSTLESFSFTTGSSVSGDLSLVLQATTSQTIFDNLQLTAQTVPEPSAWAFLGIGLLAVPAAAAARSRSLRRFRL
jgi:hypothetical protein